MSKLSNKTTPLISLAVTLSAFLLLSVTGIVALTGQNKNLHAAGICSYNFSPSTVAPGGLVTINIVSAPAGDSIQGGISNGTTNLFNRRIGQGVVTVNAPTSGTGYLVYATDITTGNLCAVTSGSTQLTLSTQGGNCSYNFSSSMLAPGGTETINVASAPANDTIQGGISNGATNVFNKRVGPGVITVTAPTSGSGYLVYATDLNTGHLCAVTSGSTELTLTALSVSAKSVNLTIPVGQTQNAFVVTNNSSQVGGFEMYGYPTSKGPGINWTVGSAGLQPNGGKVQVGVQVNSNIPPGTYTGIGVIIDLQTNAKINIPVAITVTSTLSQTSCGLGSTTVAAGGQLGFGYNNSPGGESIFIWDGGSHRYNLGTSTTGPQLVSFTVPSSVIPGSYGGFVGSVPCGPVTVTSPLNFPPSASPSASPITPPF